MYRARLLLSGFRCVALFNVLFAIAPATHQN